MRETAQYASVGHRYSHRAINRIGYWWFLASDSLLFFGLLVSRFYLLGTTRPEELNQVLGLVITGILLSSSLTAYRAETAIHNDDQRTFTRNLLYTILLGLVFLGGVAFEWSQAFIYFPPGTIFGTVFFSMTGLHGLHVFSGVLLLALIYWKGRKGLYSSQNDWPPEAIVKYWHFVDVIWIFFYMALYLVR